MMEAGCSLPGYRLKEIRKLPGCLPKKIDCPFSKDGKQIITVRSKNSLVIWDIASGQPQRELNQLGQYQKLAHFNSVQKELLFLGVDAELDKYYDLYKNIHKYNIDSDAKNVFPISPVQDFKREDVSSNYHKIMLPSCLK